MMRRKRARKAVITLISALGILYLSIIAGKYLFINDFKKTKSVPIELHETYTNQNGDTPQANSRSWNLILVNSSNPIPDDYSIELVDLANGRQVDARIYPDLQQMFDDARAQGIYPVVGEGYRTTEEQQALMTEKVEQYLAEGYDKEESAELAKEWVALPGYSEHQVGLAVDINADKSVSTNEDVYQWLAENAYKYGFILRYPEEKENITGTAYEPWHYRYVGKEAALDIYSKRICLEEYLSDEYIK